MSPALEVGFYGKLPSHGDFIRRRVSDGFVGVWDAWLQEGLTASRSSLADRWLNVYLTSPVWRFACGRGTCGPAPIIGVMVPSVDRVGRYFPLTVVAELPPETPQLLPAVFRAQPFFDAAERLVVETLEHEHIDFENFDEQLILLGRNLESHAEATPVILDPGSSAVLDDGAESWQIPIGSTADLCGAFTQLISQRLSELYAPLSLWWTEGSAIVQPTCLLVRGLPHPESFASLLDGSWSAGRWRSVPAHVETPATPTEQLVDDVAPPRFRSAAASDVGRVREINQDSFLERTDVGIWVVADGLGGHSDGEVASRMVCDALADVVPDSSFEDLVDAARRRVSEVNDHLVRAANRPVNAVQSGSTVVALLARGTRYAVLWAGDSRAYRWRDGRLEQLTRDHSVQDGDGHGVDSHAITRAVGGEETLELDVHRDRVHRGDRFLLCSDGLFRTVSHDQLEKWLANDDIQSAVQSLVAAALDTGGPDNVTALVVEAIA
jgi:type VI secretion system protein ImpM